MRVTYPTAKFNFTDVTALADSKVMTAAVKEFAIPVLCKENIRQVVYGTMELNQFILDGSREIFPNEQPEDVPFWSDEKSGADGYYIKNPMLEITFSQAHSSVGLTIYFAEDIPAEILITWYTLYGTKLNTQTFYPNAKEFFCKCHVQNFGKIVFEIVRSSFPYRYTKIDYIEYGRVWTMGRDNIKSAKVYEEMDPISATLSINTAEMEIIDEVGDFDLTNQNGLWKSLQKEQQIDFTEYVDGDAVECGSFYLNDWSCSKNIVKLSFVDILGIMDKTQFYGGRIYVSEKAGIIIDEIFASCGITKYSVTEEVYNMLLSGWLSIQSHRAALQQVVFACGAVADCSRSDMVKIYMPHRHVSRSIGLERKFQGATVQLDEYISAVTVGYQEYALAAAVEQISKSILSKGNSRIEFSKPYHPESIIVSAGELLEAYTNYAVVFMEEAGECILHGIKYEVMENCCTEVLPVVEAGEIPKTKSYKGATLVDSVRAKVLATKILNFYQLRQLVSLRYINQKEGVGNWCDISTVEDEHFITGIMNQTLDLSGGNIATAQCRGYSRVVVTEYFSGTELYGGGEGII